MASPVPQVSLKTHIPEVGPAQPVAQRRFESLHKDTPHIVAHPFIEDSAQETAKLLRQHRALGDGRPFLVERQSVGIDSLHHRDELHPVCANLVTQEAVDLQRIVRVDPIDCGQHVELDAVLLQQAHPAHHPVERGAARPYPGGKYRGAEAARPG